MIYPGSEAIVTWWLLLVDTSKLPKQNPITHMKQPRQMVPMWNFHTFKGFFWK
jgi:hypothetical protein